MNNLEVLRAELAQPIRVVSGYRTPSYNSQVGGARRSQHLCGRAADIQVNSYSPDQVHAKIEELILARRMKQGGLGLYNTFVHYDVRGTKARWDNRTSRTASVYAEGQEMVNRILRPDPPGTHENSSPPASSSSPSAPAPAVTPSSPATTSPTGVALIKQFEGFRSNLYNDAAGHCTIGYGHLVHQGRCDGSEPSEFTAGISEARATELLQQRLRRFEEAISRHVTVPLNQNQFDALASFVFNIGTGAFAGSTLLKKLNGGEYSEVPVQMRRWNQAGGRVLPGLVTRRNQEATLFATPMPARPPFRSLAV